MRDKVTHPDFGSRMTTAADANPNVPPKNYGRLEWIASRMETAGFPTTIETVRKWFAGETVPRHNKIGALAEILGVDDSWLTFGNEPTSSPKVVRARNAMASGAVNIVAGFIQSAGGTVSFEEGSLIDFRAIIKGAHYPFHVTVAERREGNFVFSIPAAAVDAESPVIGVLFTSPVAVEMVLLDADAVRERGSRKNTRWEVDSTSDWKRITTFAERL